MSRSVLPKGLKSAIRGPMFGPDGELRGLVPRAVGGGRGVDSATAAWGGAAQSR